VYPKDNTPGCTNQACNIRDNYKDLQDRGIVILGVSADTEAQHQKFITKFDLPYPLLADVDKKLINPIWSVGRKEIYGKNI